MCLFWAYMSTAWNMLCGFSGLLSLGHGIYVAIGAYVATILVNNFNITPLVGLVVACAIAALVAVLIGFPSSTCAAPITPCPPWLSARAWWCC